jgi:hypothetical protein
LLEAWTHYGSMNEWFVNWSQLMQLWQKIIVIPMSIVIREKGFSKQNAIKNHL